MANQQAKSTSLEYFKEIYEVDKEQPTNFLSYAEKLLIFDVKSTFVWI
jgi:hypothetical protein